MIHPDLKDQIDKGGFYRAYRGLDEYFRDTFMNPASREVARYIVQSGPAFADSPSRKKTKKGFFYERGCLITNFSEVQKVIPKLTRNLFQKTVTKLREDGFITAQKTRRGIKIKSLYYNYLCSGKAEDLPKEAH
jgi:hypothetical protein